VILKVVRPSVQSSSRFVFVRFTSAGLDVVKVEADRRGMSVQQLLRESTLRTVRAASRSRSALTVGSAQQRRGLATRQTI
jgi:hypothetical protein